MSDTEARVREGLQAEGITKPGPKLVALVSDALARAQEELPAGVRMHGFDAGELLADTPELIDRTTGPLEQPRTEMSNVIAELLNEVVAALLEDDDDS